MFQQETFIAKTVFSSTEISGNIFYISLSIVISINVNPKFCHQTLGGTVQ